jgi:hypothetical protein
MKGGDEARSVGGIYDNILFKLVQVREAKVKTAINTVLKGAGNKFDCFAGAL